MEVLIAIVAYFIVGFLLGKAYSLYIKTSYKDMSEEFQIATILITLLFPLAFLFVVSLFLCKYFESALKKFI